MFNIPRTEPFQALPPKAVPKTTLPPLKRQKHNTSINAEMCKMLSSLDKLQEKLLALPYQYKEIKKHIQGIDYMLAVIEAMDEESVIQGDTDEIEGPPPTPAHRDKDAMYWPSPTTPPKLPSISLSAQADLPAKPPAVPFPANYPLRNTGRSRAKGSRGNHHPHAQAPSRNSENSSHGFLAPPAPHNNGGFKAPKVPNVQTSNSFASKTVNSKKPQSKKERLAKKAATVVPASPDKSADVTGSVTAADDIDAQINSIVEGDANAKGFSTTAAGTAPPTNSPIVSRPVRAQKAKSIEQETAAPDANSNPQIARMVAAANANGIRMSSPLAQVAFTAPPPPTTPESSPAVCASNPTPQAVPTIHFAPTVLLDHSGIKITRTHTTTPSPSKAIRAASAGRLLGSPDVDTRSRSPGGSSRPSSPFAETLVAATSRRAHKRLISNPITRPDRDVTSGLLIDDLIQPRFFRLKAGDPRASHNDVFTSDDGLDVRSEMEPEKTFFFDILQQYYSTPRLQVAFSKMSLFHLTPPESQDGVGQNPRKSYARLMSLESVDEDVL